VQEVIEQIMEIDQHLIVHLQPALFKAGDVSMGVLELIPKLWFAAEALTSPDAKKRKIGLEDLINEGAARFSPLLSYLIFTRISDPDLDIRISVINALADILGPDESGLPAPEVIRVDLYMHLSRMEAQQVKSLVEAVNYDSTVEIAAESLLKACPLAGSYLADILADRTQPLEVRELCAMYIGRIGYLDAIPVLERVAKKLEAKMNGQQTMPFGRIKNRGELILLPAIHSALDSLQQP
jgi:hypothetical protein